MVGFLDIAKYALGGDGLSVIPMFLLFIISCVYLIKTVEEM